MPVYSLPILIK